MGSIPISGISRRAAAAHFVLEPGRKENKSVTVWCVGSLYGLLRRCVDDTIAAADCFRTCSI